MIQRIVHVVSILSSAFVLLVVGPHASAEPVDLSICAEATQVSTETSHRDLGRGVVAYRAEIALPEKFTFVDQMLHECESGLRLTLRMQAQVHEDDHPLYANQREYDLETDVTELFVSLIEEQGVHSFDYVEKKARVLGSDVFRGVMEDENCACALIYPDLRGEKKPFEIEKEG